MTIDEILKEFDEVYSGSQHDCYYDEAKRFLKQSLESYAKERVIEELEKTIERDGNGACTMSIYDVRERILELKGESR